MNSPAATVRKIRENFSSLWDVLLFIRIIFLAAVLRAMLRLLSIPRLMKLLTPRTISDSRNPATDEVREKIVKYTDYIFGLNFWMFKNTCLRRSLVLYHFLRQAGIDVQICFGVRYKEDSQQEGSSKELEGHAWLLYKGDIFLERNAAMASEYTVTYCFPAGGFHVSKEGLEFTGEKR
jgi:hypothetical protein